MTEGFDFSNTKPNYTLRRFKTLIAIIACTASATLLFTWRTADSTAATVLAGIIYLLTGLWLTIRFARPRIPILFSLSRNAGTPVPANPSKSA